MVNFKNIQQLKKWLSANKIDSAQWGTSSVKSIENLWLEIVAGEAIIKENPPLRVVKLAHIIIRNDGKILIEGHQHRGQHHSRYRGLIPSEKIKHGESACDAAIRGLREELLIPSHDIKVIVCSQEPKREIRASNSYPGLITEYIIYAVEVAVKGLPHNEFWTRETSHTPNASVIEHQWLWLPEEQLIHDDL
jgi:hypothetical protein